MNADYIAGLEEAYRLLNLDEELDYGPGRILKRIEQMKTTPDTTEPDRTSMSREQLESALAQREDQLRRAEARLKESAKDWADDDTAIREICKPYLSGLELNGDSYGVPTMIEVVRRAVDKVEAQCAFLSIRLVSILELLLLNDNDKSMFSVSSTKAILGLFKEQIPSDREEIGVQDVRVKPHKDDILGPDKKEREGRELAQKETTETSEVSGVVQGISQKTPGEGQVRSTEERPTEIQVSVDAAERCCFGEGNETRNLLSVRKPWSDPCTSQRLYKAVSSGVALHYLSRKEAQDIIGALSTDCGKSIIARLEEARWLLGQNWTYHTRSMDDSIRRHKWLERRDSWLSGHTPTGESDRAQLATARDLLSRCPGIRTDETREYWDEVQAFLGK